MNIIALSDLHGEYTRLPAIAGDLSAADVVLLTGDMTHFGHRTAAEQIVNAVRAFNPNVLAVPGNCDYPEVADFLTESEINLHCGSMEVGQITFVGVGGSLPCPGATPFELSEEELEHCLCSAMEGIVPGTPLVLVSHQPPWGTKADKLHSTAHVGSRALRTFIEEHDPLACFCGHIHEGRGIDTIGTCCVINPGPLGYGCHAFAKINRRVEKVEIRGAHGEIEDATECGQI